MHLWKCSVLICVVCVRSKTGRIRKEVEEKVPDKCGGVSNSDRDLTAAVFWRYTLLCIICRVNFAGADKKRKQTNRSEQAKETITDKG